MSRWSSSSRAAFSSRSLSLAEDRRGKLKAPETVVARSAALCSAESIWSAGSDTAIIVVVTVPVLAGGGIVILAVAASGGVVVIVIVVVVVFSDVLAGVVD